MHDLIPFHHYPTFQVRITVAIHFNALEDWLDINNLLSMYIYCCVTFTPSFILCIMLFLLDVVVIYCRSFPCHQSSTTVLRLENKLYCSLFNFDPSPPHVNTLLEGSDALSGKISTFQIIKRMLNRDSTVTIVFTTLITSILHSYSIKYSHHLGPPLSPFHYLSPLTTCSP